MRQSDPYFQQFTFLVLELFAFENTADLFWRVDHGDLRFYVDCSDVFSWGAADLEEITDENIKLLRDTRSEAVVVCQNKYPDLWPELFCARVRGMLPQAPFMEKWVTNEAMRELFYEAVKP